MLTIHDISRDFKKYLNTDVSISGWVLTVRSSTNVGFIKLRDGSNFGGIQIVFEKKLANFSVIEKIPVGSAIKVEGKLVESKGGEQSYELLTEKIKVLNEATADFPLQKKRHSFEFLREIADLRPRTNTFQAVFRLRSELIFALHSFFHKKNFVHIHTPIISASDCEGAGEMFTVSSLDFNKIPHEKNGEVDFSQDFFGQKVGLTVSGQLNAEAFAHAFRNVYAFGPTFRAENSNTARHVAEFWMLEPEIAFANLNNSIDLAEEMLQYVINYVFENLPTEMNFFNTFIDKTLKDRLQKIAKNPFKRISYTKAIEVLKTTDEKFEYPVKWGIDLQTEHEKWLCKKYDSPVFVTDYPKEIKAFYMRLNDDKKTVAAMDLLVPNIGELIGGSQREDRLNILDTRLKECNLNPKDYDWYRNIRRFGGVEHAGFGLGFERLVLYLSGMTNIRDVVAFPRTPKNAKF